MIETRPLAHPTAYELPPWWATLLEARALLEALGLLFRLAALRRAPRGDRRPILIVPGFLADRYAVRPLGWYLSYLGYGVFDWGLGRNLGDVEDDIDRLGERVTKIAADLDQSPLTLIGWSLGGVLTREVARQFPKAVREVITLGTPIVGGPRSTVFGRCFVKWKKLNLAEIEREIHRRGSLGLHQAVTSIYSKSDGIVGWRSSIDVYNPQAKNIEVKSSHLGLGVNPRVWLEIAKILAASTAPVDAKPKTPPALRRAEGSEEGAVLE